MHTSLNYCSVFLWKHKLCYYRFQVEDILIHLNSTAFMGNASSQPLASIEAAIFVQYPPTTFFTEVSSRSWLGWWDPSSRCIVFGPERVSEQSSFGDQTIKHKICELSKTRFPTMWREYNCRERKQSKIPKKGKSKRGVEDTNCTWVPGQDVSMA